MKSRLTRIYELDLLRGFFILVIVIDHFQRWPSGFSYITGEGRLWVSAAEGFFIISGLLIGYLRGYKSRNEPLSNVAKVLVKRAALLYIWAVGITFAVVAMSVWFASGDPLIPMGPNAEQTATLGTYIWNVLSQMYSSDWIFFLRLYAIMLLVSPLYVFLLRRGKWWVAGIISLAIYGASFLLETPEAAMQWQLLFFTAGIIGYHLDAMRSWFANHPVKQMYIAFGLILVTIATMIASYFWVLGWDYIESPDSRISRDSYIAARSVIDPLFSKDPMMPLRVALSFVWVGGLFALFHYGRRFIMKWFGWLLMLFGQRSLSAYCLQALLLMPLQLIVPLSESFLLNTLMGICLLVLFWVILRLPIVSRALPR